ncbi:phytoene desaturase family protein [Pseudobacteroides cellulosolvens]|uniref:Phytoene desaturase n=1 Tax=Pseudobacteroides cellulosolvens ATCC 35603 = DSM 2933 TaxID=398512 RepID=A0A0L6JVN8_9FIRM|nr:phytoene desaturase family protein [Pseudobacteroides cellulosolvens]KNY29898.1 phytoene desaturase [Pseudobacteroides cellulosolvens ATCC 35603 = DSM 2933]
MSKKVVIVGAGPGGLSAGMLLAYNGYDVHIYEKKDCVGGRNGKIVLGDFKFDIGPTFLMLPKILEDIFSFTGRDINSYLELIPIDPFYRLRFRGQVDFLPSFNKDYTVKQIEKLFPGDEGGYIEFMDREKLKFEKLFGCLKIPYHSFIHFLRPQFLKAIPKFDLTKTLHSKLSEYFKYEDMRIAMTFQSKYLGMSPWTCPGAFTILSYIEHKMGIFHPIGGLFKISEAMAKVIDEEGGKIHLSKAVKEIIVEKGTAKGLELMDGEKVMADYVIINADFAHAMTNIVDKRNRKKYTDKDLESRDYSCSTFMLYLGLNKKYHINHHNIIFANDYKKNVNDIAELKVLSDDPSFYIQNASVIDPTLAPEGKSALYVLVPVPNNSSGIDWKKEKERFRRLVIDKIKEKTELKDIEEHIEVEKIITPHDWEHEYGVYKGATFNLSHKLSQMLYFRPHNKFQEFKNCYLVGGGTHPGSGLPTIYESGRISANLIMQDGALGLGFDYQDVFEKKTVKDKGIGV